MLLNFLEPYLAWEHSVREEGVQLSLLLYIQKPKQSHRLCLLMVKLYVLQSVHVPVDPHSGLSNLGQMAWKGKLPLHAILQNSIKTHHIWGHYFPNIKFICMSGK